MADLYIAFVCVREALSLPPPLKRVGWWQMVWANIRAKSETPTALLWWAFHPKITQVARWPVWNFNVFGSHEPLSLAVAIIMRRDNWWVIFWLAAPLQLLVRCSPPIPLASNSAISVTPCQSMQLLPSARPCPPLLNKSKISTWPMPFSLRWNPVHPRRYASNATPTTCRASIPGGSIPLVKARAMLGGYSPRPWMALRSPRPWP